MVRSGDLNSWPVLWVVPSSTFFIQLPYVNTYLFNQDSPCDSCQKSGWLWFWPVIVQGHHLGPQASPWLTLAALPFPGLHGWRDCIWETVVTLLDILCSEPKAANVMQIKAPAIEPYGCFCRHRTEEPQDPRAQQARSLPALQGKEMSPVDGVSDREAGNTKGPKRGWGC